MESRSQCITAFFLLIILSGNFLHSVFWHNLRLSPPWHDHIILGPVYSGWEHHHGELTNAQESYPAHGQLIALTRNEQTIFAQNEAGMRSKVISLYRSPLGDGTILSFEVQLLWLAAWPSLAIFPLLTWPLDLAALRLSSAFLPPPDKPPLYL